MSNVNFLSLQDMQDLPQEIKRTVWEGNIRNTNYFELKRRGELTLEAVAIVNEPNALEQRCKFSRRLSPRAKGGEAKRTPSLFYMKIGRERIFCRVFAEKSKINLLLSHRFRREAKFCQFFEQKKVSLSPFWADFTSLLLSLFKS